MYLDWRQDFIFDRTTSGHSLKSLPIVGKYQTSYITLGVEQTMTCEDTTSRSSELFVMYGIR